jgi:predicted transcriptional regulator
LVLLGRTRHLPNGRHQVGDHHLTSTRLGTTSVRSPPALRIPMVCWHTMKRTTVKLPDELDARLRHEAERRSKTVSELTREAIESLLGNSGKKRRLTAAAAGRSGQSDVSERIEEILRSEVFTNSDR